MSDGGSPIGINAEYMNENGFSLTKRRLTGAGSVRDVAQKINSAKVNLEWLRVREQKPT